MFARNVVLLQSSNNSMPSSYDAIVIGCGGFGSAVLYWLSRLGPGGRYLAIEQFSLGHDRGSSQDHSRIIRLAYHESCYAAIAPEAYVCWNAIEEESGVQVLLKTGGLVIERPEELANKPGGVRTLPAYVDAMHERGIPFEELGGREVSKRWPQFVFDDTERAVYQQDAGLVDAAKGNAVHRALARARGGEILAETPVREIRTSGSAIEVVTDTGRYQGGRLIVTSGAWTNRVLAGAGIELPLRVTQEQVTYFATEHLREFCPDRFPVWIWHGTHSYYGFPVYGEVATKMGEHNGGPVVTADTRTFDPDPVRERRYSEFMARHIPRGGGPILVTKTCLYTVPPDQNFVLSTLPGDDRISLAIGAGHGYKFAGFMGRTLAEFALRGSASAPVDAFRADRPALTDPAYVPTLHTAQPTPT